MSRVMLIAPHADDEVLGAGGTLLRLMAEGHEVKIVLAACADCWFHHLQRIVSKAEREAEFLASAARLSSTDPVLLGLPERNLDQYPVGDLVHTLDGLLASWQPDWLFISEPSYHQDHQMIHRACVAALRPTGGPRPGKVCSYEVPTSTWGSDFRPSLYVSLTPEQVEGKVSILRDAYPSQYSAEVRGRLTERGMRDHLRYRGNEAGCESAEAFTVLREVW